MIKFSVIGHSKTGKTTLIRNLIEHYTGLGIKVCSAKNIHRQGFSFDRVDSDTELHRRAGSYSVLGMTEKEKALFFDPSTSFDIFLKIFEILDHEILIIEGMKEKEFPCIVCGRTFNDIAEFKDRNNILFYSLQEISGGEDLKDPVLSPSEDLKKMIDIIDKRLINIP